MIHYSMLRPCVIHIEISIGRENQEQLNWCKLKLRVNSRAKGRSFKKYASHTEHLSSVCKEYPVRNFQCVFLISLETYIASSTCKYQLLFRYSLTDLEI